MHLYVCFCVDICCELLFAVHAVLSEAFSKGVGIDLQLCDLKKNQQNVYSQFTFSLFLFFAPIFLTLHRIFYIYIYLVLLKEMLSLLEKTDKSEVQLLGTESIFCTSPYPCNLNLQFSTHLIKPVCVCSEWDMIYECLILATFRICFSLTVTVVLVHLVVLVPKPRELRLSQAFSQALVVHFLVHGFLQVLNIRGR